MTTNRLPRGFVPLLETPFFEDGSIDYDGLLALIEDTIAGGTNGLTAPLVASEVHALTKEERQQIITIAAAAIGGRVPFIAGASSDDPDLARHFARIAADTGATAYIVAVPPALYGHPAQDVVTFFQSVVDGIETPLIIQDLQWNGPGLDLTTIKRLRDALPTLAGLKIETYRQAPSTRRFATRSGRISSSRWMGGSPTYRGVGPWRRRHDSRIGPCTRLREIYKAYSGGDRSEAVPPLP